MAVMRKKDIKKLDAKGIGEKMNELHLELAKERANIAVGANVTSPGRLKEIKRTIARLKTEMKTKAVSEKAKGGSAQ